ncbi:MAG: GTPase HflX [Eggerthellaceae bacterium]|nr:GTPase HflX [Eubacterium sp.]HBM32514.1 GTPase HflX [Oscillospiraceae bacterium]HCK50256.1 GTPase HflX [Oscillospiraceae bacterium]
MEEKHLTRAILIGADTGEYDAESSMDELSELAKTAGAEELARVLQKREAYEPATVIGEGKLAEVKELCGSLGAELLIFDCELTASQIRNVEDETDVRVIDRTMLILDIFAGRAVSREGKLQVELAQLKYRLPRLMGIGASLSRLGGGIGTRGPGETQLETDRRHIRRRIDKLSAELKELEERRGYARDRRKKDSVQVGAIVGYTNAGKSTLLNLLTGADVLAEDKLFATLDPTSRAIELPDGRSLLLVDTVGLIRRLPHHLVEAFKSTLEEAACADIIIHVCDVSDPEAAEKADVTLKTLADLGAAEIPVVTVLNKCDLLTENIPEDDSTVKISAKKAQGIDRLLKVVAANLPETAKRMKLLLPYDKAGFTAKLRENGKVFTEEYTETGVLVDALVDQMLIKQMSQYETE